MRIYLVGGAVRDTIMGVEPKDRDYVVVGSSPEEMLALGYEQVGASFPVFLKNGEEYALARQERKTGVGYNGFETVFDPSITLEDDLLRRDLTMNAMAMDLETGFLIDPYGGRADITEGVLRHTSEAFAEDPVRVLRTARFAARYGFDIADETVVLMSKVVPEIDHVPAERVFAEFAKGMAEQRPYLMLDALSACEAERASAVKPYMKMWLRNSLKWINDTTPMYVRFALLMTSFADADYETCKIPTEYARVSKTVNMNFNELLTLHESTPEQFVDMMDRMRAYSNPAHSEQVFDVMKVYMRRLTPDVYAAWKHAVNSKLSASANIDAAAIAASCSNGREIKAKIAAARAEAIKAL